MKHISKKLTIISAALVLLLNSTTQASPVTNLVTNGSMNFSLGKPTGWTLITPGGELWNTFESGILSSDGGSYFGIQDLDAFAPRFSAGGIYQTIDNLTVGATYSLSFESNEEHTNPNFLAQWKVSFGNQTGFSTLTNTTWVTDTLQFTATNTSETLKFLATFLPGANPQILNLDGVTLTQISSVPVPASIWLFGSAIAGLIRYGRRKSI